MCGDVQLLKVYYLKITLLGARQGDLELYLAHVALEKMIQARRLNQKMNYL